MSPEKSADSRSRRTSYGLRSDLGHKISLVCASAASLFDLEIPHSVTPGTGEDDQRAMWGFFKGSSPSSATEQQESSPKEEEAKTKASGDAKEVT